MKFIRCALLFCFITAVLVTGCQAQTRHEDRQPAVAGQFYPSDKNELRALVDDLFARAAPSEGIQNVVAVITPHAGYAFSGVVAASAFNQVDPAKSYDNIFILGPSHHVGFEGASVYTLGNFITPLGIVKVNTGLAQELVDKNPVFSPRTDAQASEHSIEVQLPLLQVRMKKDFRIVPVVIGSGFPETGERELAIYQKIASALQPYFTPKNLFVISTDFSHYPEYDAAAIVDKATADAVLSNSVKNLTGVYDANAARGVPNLVTSMCGLSGVLSFLYMTQDNPSLKFRLVQYRNAGDVPGGDKSRVVGYCAIAVSAPAGEKTGFRLDEKEKTTLLRLARQTITQYVTRHSMPDVDPSGLSGNLRTNCGAFVTLNKDGSLRGCIGRFDPDEPLYKVVQQMAVAAATQDYRFSAVDEKEIPGLEIEISVLTPLKKITSIDEIELGRDGIYIRKGAQSGTFLPQVATQTGWSKEEFLGHCSQEKAGLGWDGWKDADLYTYEALVFGEH